MAESLYTCLVTNDEVCATDDDDVVEQVLECLSLTAWDADIGDLHREQHATLRTLLQLTSHAATAAL